MPPISCVVFHSDFHDSSQLLASMSRFYGRHERNPLQRSVQYCGLFAVCVCYVSVCVTKSPPTMHVPRARMLQAFAGGATRRGDRRTINASRNCFCVTIS